MVFNSYLFVLFFLPFTWCGYFALLKLRKTDIAKIFLIICSFGFYGYNNKMHIFILLFSIIFNYLFATKVLGARRSAWILWVGIITNISLLGYFKYLNFGIEIINNVFKFSWQELDIIMPLGISFFTFQQIAFLIGVYQKKIQNVKFINYCLFVSFFPQLIAGPIVSYDEVVCQLDEDDKKKINWDSLAKGIYIFIYGLAKKVLLADNLAIIVDSGYSNLQQLNMISVCIIMISYSLQIYFDFSGYCDMAVGLAEMFNITLPINFNSPYKAKSIQEFWRRWHITLTRFLTEYIYIPLGGSRVEKNKVWRNILIVFFVSGIWHGANWTYILWGILHGILLVIDKISGKIQLKIPVCIRWGITFITVTLLWSLFRADTISDEMQLLSQCLIWGDGKITQALKNSLYGITFAKGLMQLPINNLIDDNITIIVCALLIILIMICKYTRNIIERTETIRYSVVSSLFTAFLFMYCVISFAGMSKFIYFNF